MKKHWTFFLKLLRNYHNSLLSLLVIFIVGIFTVQFISASDQEIIFQAIVQRMLEIDTSNNFLLFLRIWGNNSLVLTMSFLGGFLYFPVYLIEWMNGLVLSLVALKVLPETGLALIFLGLLPHGIIELPAFFLGSWLSILWWTKIYRKAKIEADLSRWDFTKKISLYFVALIIFLGMASLIEVYVTPFFVNLLLLK